MTLLSSSSIFSLLICTTRTFLFASYLSRIPSSTISLPRENWFCFKIHFFVLFYLIAINKGLNLTKELDSGRFFFIDCVSNEKKKDVDFFRFEEREGGKRLFELVRQRAYEEREKKRRVCLAIDGVDRLSLFCEEKENAHLFSYFRSLLSSNEPLCSLILVGCSDMEEETHLQEHNADLVFSLSKLSTGHSKDTTGQVKKKIILPLLFSQFNADVNQRQEQARSLEGVPLPSLFGGRKQFSAL